MRMDKKSRPRLQRKRKQAQGGHDDDSDVPSPWGSQKKRPSAPEKPQRLQRKRKQSSDDQEEARAFKYRTPNVKENADDNISEKAGSPALSSDWSSENESSDEGSLCSWGSSESDHGDTNDDLSSARDHVIDDAKKAKREQQKYEELCKEEESVLNNMKSYWTSEVARKARKITKNKSDVGNPTKIEELRCFAAKRFAGLPFVVSIGVENDREVNVYVTNKEKAVELSRELANPGINLVEATYSHFI